MQMMICIYKKPVDAYRKNNNSAQNTAWQYGQQQQWVVIIERICDGTKHDGKQIVIGILLPSLLIASFNSDLSRQTIA